MSNYFIDGKLIDTTKTTVTISKKNGLNISGTKCIKSGNTVQCGNFKLILSDNKYTIYIDDKNVSSGTVPENEIMTIEYDHLTKKILSNLK